MAYPGVPGIDSSYLTQINGIDVSDEDASEHFCFGLGTTSLSEARRRIRCDWRNRIDLAAYLLGGSQVIAGTPFVVSGQPYPDNANFVCQDVATKGDGTKSIGANSMVAYQRAALDVIYRSPTWNFGDATLTGTQELTYSSSAIAIDTQTNLFKWSAGTDINKDVPASTVAVLKVCSCSFTIVRYNQPLIPFSTIMSLLGCVNNSSFYGAAAETALFVGGRSFRKLAIGTTFNWDISLSFLVTSQDRTHNSLYHKYGWQPFVNKQTGNKFFTTANLGALFT